MPRRLAKPIDPVEIFHDGASVVAQRGEPLVHALLAAGRLPLARSPKLHRPRGPYCLRGACDGCLARVDGVPNVMTCQRPAVGGERVETQNVLGTRGIDALRAADFLFPNGIDHHRLFAGIRGVSELVQSFARRVAGLGKLPDDVLPVFAGERREVDVLVVGGGAAGLAAARSFGARALLVHDAPSFGGSLAALEPAAIDGAVTAARAAGAELLASTLAVALFREPEREDGRLHALLVGPGGATLVLARRVVVASGALDPVLAFENNDLPGVYSARAGLELLRAGISLGDRVALLGTGRFARAFAEATGESHVVEVDPAFLVRVVGRSAVSGVLVRAEGRERRERVEAVLVDGPGAPAYELAVQAGARAVFDPERGYRLEVGAAGEVAEGVYAAGSVARLGRDAADEGARVAQVVIAGLD